MDRTRLFQQIQKKKSFLCVGLDTDIEKIPQHLLQADDPVFEFNKAIVEATCQLAVAYKPNLAFYEAMGPRGWESLAKTVAHIRTTDPGIFLIADAKRGDIGNTSAMYAKTFFVTYNFDAVTLSPYMGLDTVAPFLSFTGKWAVVLALTSNKSATDFQYFTDGKSKKKLFENVLEKGQSWGTPDQIMFVVGATKAEAFKGIREIAPDNFLLVPGIGAQGGSLEEVAHFGMNGHCGLLVNSSRGIIYASAGTDFATRAADSAESLRKEMEVHLRQKGLL
ncbi:MAG: orotidine-5'-phosphate decarboxylase [Bacteroidales bacterium]|nr:orotidine-5'-phosphate decarboxylase [Bacteroidales bacterium]